MNTPTGFQVEMHRTFDTTWTVIVYDSKGTPKMYFKGMNEALATHTYNTWVGKLRTNQNLLDFPVVGIAYHTVT
jgi:hypothetical protein